MTGCVQKPLRSFSMPVQRPRGKQSRQAFTLVEVTLSLIVFMMMILVFAAVFPFAVRTAQFSNDYAQASLLAQHKIDELLAAGYNRMDFTDLSGLGIIDAATNTSPYTFTGVDNLDGGGAATGYFRPGSSGTITIVDFNTVNASIQPGKMDYATIKLTWTSVTGSTSSYSASVVL
jgi:type II secretory pathway pseudopilin PulG